MISLTLPIRTVSESNAREHWAVKARRAKRQRHATALALRGLVQDLPPWSHLFVTLTRVSPGTLDVDNNVSSAKHIQDGIADALGIDDGDPRVSWFYAQERAPRGHYAVRVEVALLQVSRNAPDALGREKGRRRNENASTGAGRKTRARKTGV